LAELTQEQYERIQARGLETFVAGEGLLDPVQAHLTPRETGIDSVAVDRPPFARDVTAIYRSARTELA
jgi:hypothetical protein